MSAKARTWVVAGVGIAAGALLALAGPYFGAVGQYYSPTQATGTVDKARVRPGESVRFSGSGFRPSTRVDISFRSQEQSLGTTSSDGAGAFSAVVTIPSSATAGLHQLVATGTNPQGGTHTVIADITVAGLPVSGRSIRRDVVWAFSLLTMGELLIGADLLLRRRRAARAQRAPQG